MRPERSYATCSRWSMNPSLSICIGGAVPCTDLQVSDPVKKDTPHVIKDFISSLKKNIRNKIANRWAEMRHPPNTVERAFELASDVAKQLQVADSFKLDFPTYPSRELNEMCVEESSGDEHEVNEIAKNRKWVSNSSSYNRKHSNANNNHNSNYRHQQQ